MVEVRRWVLPVLLLGGVGAGAVIVIRARTRPADDAPPPAPLPAVPAPASPASAPLPGSAAPLPDGSAPGPDFTIKGNGQSRLYHPPTSPYYGRTRAEVWFRTEADAEAAGFRAYRSRAKK